MAETIPTTEPASVRAGDTWRWQISVPAYPAPTWTLTYTLFSAAGTLALVSSASGSAHLIDQSPAETAGYTAGQYHYVLHASDGTDRFQIGEGVIEVLPNLSALDSYDGRSHAKQMLDAIDAMMLGRATDGDLDVIAVTTGTGRGTTWSPAELMRIRSHYAAQVAHEQDMAARARGERTGVVQLSFRQDGR
jgi:hypothetical protein